MPCLQLIRYNFVHTYVPAFVLAFARPFALSVSGLFDWQISLESLRLRLSWREVAMKKLCYGCGLFVRLSPVIQTMCERSREFRLLILLWLHLHEKRSPSPLSYMKYNLARLLFHNLLSWPSAMPPTKSSICLDYVVWLQLDRRDIFPVISPPT